ncbi:MgtC/SapB family protein [Halomonas llamarensis]|uniref:MgtC/SapB family protein n=1 Tax=Halomonas llamarensis TaxID=2945104 RepID=A0ABT0SRX0_9GAMM|nr:MgtC/SapB family protein [Halomonas llamarensis]MCL7930580.1 MgtC/SapB family protein [Halomonas llamarensis]
MMEQLTSEFITVNQSALHLALALLLGTLIGIERGWVAREKSAGSRVAGVRTHALVGLLGGVSGLLAETLTPWAFPLMFLAIALIALVGWREQMVRSGDVSITGLIGLLLAFSFGAMAVAVSPALATACAVVTAVILDNKREIHGLLDKLQSHELDAALKLLLISAVMLPLLPNEGMGPGGVLNPYALWWMVVMIATISFVGYFAIRVGGAEKGILFTGLFAGLSSSTALTLHYARQSRLDTALSPLLASGILIACGTMFPRILIYAAIVHPALIPPLILPVTLMALSLYLPALIIWHRQRQRSPIDSPKLNQNPLELRTALMFGALLTVIMLLGKWLREWLGDTGVYLLATVSGIADVDAITLSLTRMSQDSLSIASAVLGIIIAASVNNLVKGGMAASFGTRALGLRIALPMLASVTLGALSAWGVALL